jgi:hypothetical protein
MQASSLALVGSSSMIIWWLSTKPDMVEIQRGLLDCLTDTLAFVT